MTERDGLTLVHACQTERGMGRTFWWNGIATFTLRGERGWDITAFTTYHVESVEHAGEIAAEWWIDYGQHEYS